MHLAKLAFQYCLESVEATISEMNKVKDPEPKIKDPEPKVTDPTTGDTSLSQSTKPQEESGDKGSVGVESKDSETGKEKDKSEVKDKEPEVKATGSEADAKDAEKSDKDADLKLLLSVHKVWQHGVKNHMETERVNKMFRTTYTTFKKGQVGFVHCRIFTVECPCVTQKLLNILSCHSHG